MKIACLALFVAVAAAVQPAQPTTALAAALRLPADTLPQGCTLDRTGPQPNPAVGSDARTILLARLPIGAAPEVPDGPPLSRAEASRYEAHLADGIKEGYVARYKDANGQGVGVYAVLFADPEDARVLAAAARRRPASATFALAQNIVVSVQGGSTCAKAIAAALRAR